MLIQEKCDKYSINYPCNAGDLFKPDLQGLNTLCEQRQLFSSVDGLGFEAQESATRVQSAECQASAHSAELAPENGDMTNFEKSVRVAQHQLTNAQLALYTVECGRNEYCSRLGVE